MESVQVWDSDGATDSEYFYMDAENSMTGEAGWFMDDFTTSANGITINKGCSIAFQSQGSVSVQFAGQVASTPASVTTGDSGFTMIGNNTPVDAALKDITFEGISAMDSIQVMDPDGATEAEYFYMDAENSMTGEAGWFMDDFTTSADNVVIKAGAGVLFQAANGCSVKVTMPTVL